MEKRGSKTICSIHKRPLVSKATRFWEKICAAARPQLWYCPLGCIVNNCSYTKHMQSCPRCPAKLEHMAAMTTTSTVSICETANVDAVSLRHRCHLRLTLKCGQLVSATVLEHFPMHDNECLLAHVRLFSPLMNLCFTLRPLRLGPVPIPEITIDPALAALQSSVQTEVAFDVVE